MNMLINSLEEKRVDNVRQFNPLLKSVIVSVIHFFGGILFFYKRYKSPPKKIKKVLFISLYFTGDILLNSPVFKLIHKSFDDAEIHIWVKSRTKDVLAGYPCFSKVYVFDDVRTRRYGESVDKNLRKKIVFFKKLKSENYDLIIDLTGLFWTALSIFYSGAKYSCGFNFQGFGFLLNFESSAIYKGHLIDKYLNVVLGDRKLSDKLKIDFISRVPNFNITEKAIKRVDNIFDEYKIRKNVPAIVVHTTAGWEAKKWNVVNFLKLIEELNTWKEFSYFIIGGNSDSGNAQFIMKNSKAKIFDFTGKVDICESTEIIRRSMLFIGTDSGPLYLAEAVGVKTISLFGPTNPLFSAPRGNNHVHIYEKIFCSADENEQNCKLQAGLNCRTFDCMKIISVDNVIGSIKSLLKDEQIQ